MTDHRVVPRAEWIEARMQHLAREKEFTRLRDQLTRERHELPWVKIDTRYSFEGPDGPEELGDLFAGKTQLLVYHFMFDPDWEAGCKSCSYLTDHFQGALVHLAARDVSLVAVSRAPLAQIRAFQQRMQWKHRWVSSYGSEFNYDFHVSFRPDENGHVYYNYEDASFPSTEGPGISAFLRDRDGAIYHTYSSYGRGLDMFIGSYHLLDIAPRGRNEEGEPYPMNWVKHHDSY